MSPPNYVLEIRHWLLNRTVAGVDEAGRGPLAGPVVGAAVILPNYSSVDVPRDSKKLTPRQREKMFEVIKNEALSIGIGIVQPEEIDDINILNAALKAMTVAVANLKPSPDVVLIDGGRGLREGIYKNIAQEPIVRGDTKCCSIAAASVIAKVTRDRIMTVYDSIYPGYNFKQHKGYPTKRHLAALRELGASKIHRKTFKGVIF